MGLKEEFVKTVDNVKDAASEAGHRTEAAGEQAKRDIAGDVQADLDSAKQDARNNT
jgi:hypothetical protein